MFERFRATFQSAGVGEGDPFVHASLATCSGFRELAAECAGTAFGDGMVWMHSAATARWASRLIAENSLEFSDDFQAIAQDWTGMQFAVCARPGSRCYEQVLLFEPASGEAFEVDCDIPSLMNVELPADPVTFLAADLFAAWRAAGGVPVEPGKCVGFKVPLFLGGDGTVENLEVVDLEVYWSLLGQLRSGSKDLPPGSLVVGVKGDATDLTPSPSVLRFREELLGRWPGIDNRRG